MTAYTVAVRALCEFTAKAGDLDLRFTPSPSARDGIQGHATVAARRGAGYQSELRLEGEHRGLVVRGRADGFDAARVRLEEFKTHRGDLALQPANHRALHWAQLRVYGALLCRAQGLARVELALVYFDIGTQQETVLVEEGEAAALQRHFEAQCERFIAWAAQEAAHRAARDEALARLAFPHAAFRPGQRPLAEAVYRAAVSGRCLMAQAPTGIGKTVGTLFPLLKAAKAQALDKVYYLCAKGSGRGLALAALQRLRGDAGIGAPLRVVELVARDKACEHPDKACHGESCPLARGFYDRLGAARADAVAQSAAGTALDQPALRRVALAHGVCPYYLGQEMVRWADVVIGDYNHYFDLNALLHGLAQAQSWRIALLVDEAHNLIERGRAMYSAELRQSRLRALRRSAPPAVRPALERVHRTWNALNRAQASDYRVLPEAPGSFLNALQQAVGAIGEAFVQRPVGQDSELLAFYFEALHFSRVGELFGEHSLFDVTLEPPPAGGKRRGSVLCLRNVVPAPFLGPRLAAAHTATLFSATLQPERYHRDTLGLPASAVCVDVESPFRAEQLAVRAVSAVSTRFRDRAESVAPIVALMGRQHAAWRGNYLAFFSSFDYLQQVAQRFQAEWPQVPVWLQSRPMDEAARRAFLDRFQPDGHGIGFAVLGGSFGEGIDLPGTQLIGAFIATLGLPQVNPVNEQMKGRLEAVFGAGQGHDYAYLFPGLQKVVQAAGRVIRGPDDRGVVYLIDDRYAQARVRRLLPRWWNVASEPAPYSGPGSSLKPASATPITALTTTLIADGR